MERHQSLPAQFALIACLIVLPGCGWGGSQSDTSVEEDLVEAAEEAPATGPAAPPASTARSNPAGQLQAGDRFPLLKTVTQTLQQPTPAGWVTSRSTLEMLLSLTVEEIHPVDARQPGLDSRSGQKRLQVAYHRVRFMQELPGQPRIEYDSAAPTNPVPPAALSYHGLKDNGFGFWLSAENQVVELVAFDQFLNRCLNDVPAGKRQQAAAALVFPTAGEAVASFVDDTLGLVPASAAREGDTWIRDRHVLQPVPLHVNNKYTLRQLAPETAEIEVLGTIAAPVPYGSMHQPNREVQVVVRGGKVQGGCLVDRRSGVPVESRIEQMLEMSVRMPDGSEFDQHKQSLTTIRSLPAAGGMPIDQAATSQGTTSRVAAAPAGARDVPASAAPRR